MYRRLITNETWPPPFEELPKGARCWIYDNIIWFKLIHYSYHLSQIKTVMDKSVVIINVYNDQIQSDSCQVRK